MGAQIPDIEVLKQYGSNTEWFFRNYTTIKNEYNGKYVAVDKNKVILSETDLNKLYSEIEKKHSLLSVFVKFVPSEDIVAIL